MTTEFSIGDVAFGAAAGFLAGIVAANMGLPWFLTGTVACAAYFALGFLFSFKKMWHFGLFVFFCLFLGVFYFHLYENTAAARTNLIFNQNISFSGVVSDEPEVSAKYILFTADLRRPFAGEVTILAPPQSDFHYGDLLSIEGTIAPPSTTGDTAFSYLPQITFVSSGNGFWLREKLIAFKSAMLARFEDFLSSDEAGLLGALTLADKNGLSATLTSEMAQSGTSYLATMYGWKIGIIVFFIMGMLIGWVNRKMIAAIIATAVFLFILMADAPTSAVRAAAMACFALLARETGWRIDMRNALAFTAIGILLFDPTAIVDDVGFILSFASVLGVVYLAPAVRNIFRIHDRGFLYWKESLSIGIAAQLAVAPIIVRVFGSFPATGLIAGTFIIIALPFTMFFGWLLGVTSFFSHFFGFLVAEVARFLLAYELGIIAFFSAIAIPLDLPFGSWIATGIYYGTLIWFAWRFRPKAKRVVSSRSVILAEAGAHASGPIDFS